MILYYQGSELPTYRNLIKEMKVPGSSMSYMALRKRTNFKNPWLVSKYFPEDHRVFVDSGCGPMNYSKEQKYGTDELRGIASHYYDWIHQNIESIEYYTEFDALQLGESFIEEYRESVRDIYFDKFVPIWHTEYGLQNLRDLSSRYGRVAIFQSSTEGKDVIPLLNRLAASGVALHGLSVTKSDVMQVVPWTSICSASWITPQKYGDTTIWSYNKLKRYSADMKEQARKKERYVIQNAGFDIDKIMNDDPKELLRMSLWSWEQFISSINKKKGTGVTTFMNSRDDGFEEDLDTTVGGVVDRVANRAPTATPRDPSQKRAIPLMDFDVDVVKVKDEVTGETQLVDRPKIKIRSESMRICDTCFLAARCPMFEPGSTCAYDIPIQVETREQVHAVMNALVSIQTQRVMLGKMAEDLEGGQADPILSGEIDRLSKLLEKKHNIEAEGFSLTVTAKQQGQMSMVNRIFGDMTTQNFAALPAATEVEDVASQLGIYDAVIVEDKEVQY